MLHILTKRIGTALIALTVSAIGVMAATRSASLLDGQITIEPPKVTATGSKIEVLMTINLTALHVKHEQSVTLHPALVTAMGDTIALAPVAIHGRNAILRLQRAGKLPSQLPANVIDATTGRHSLLYRDTTSLTANDHAGQVVVTASSRRKASDPEVIYPPVTIGTYSLTATAFQPRYVYAIPATSVAKIVSARHRVGMTYADGSAEPTASSPANRVATDSLNTFISRCMSGEYPVSAVIVSASTAPGATAAARDVAAERALRIAAMIAAKFPTLADRITTRVAPNDWEGLAGWIERSSIQNRDNLLAIIERDDLDTAERLALMDRQYGAQASFLRDVIFPLLDNQTVIVQSTASALTDIKEIERVYTRRPDRLSLSELCQYFDYLNARRVKDCDDVLLKCLELYPNEPTARINAANVMMKRGNLTGAAANLRLAGTSAEAEYARGNLAALSGDLAGARRHFENAAAAGLAQAAAAIKDLDRLARF